MSDEEYEYDYGSDAEYDYGSDEDKGGNQMSDDVVEIENSYFEGEDLRFEQRDKAIELFEKVISMEENLGATVKWRFKAMQQLVVLYFTNGQYKEMVDMFCKMLAIMSQVTRNECTDAVNMVLDTIANATDVNLLTKMYELTLEALKNANSDRLWFTTNLKLARVYLEAGKVADVERLVLLLKSQCVLPDGSDDLSKGASLLDVYCLEIQLCTATRNGTRLRNIYPKTVNISTAVADPRIIGLIREEGGKMFMVEGCWDDAYNELFEAFRKYQEAGSQRAKECLKYVVVAGMLSLSGINPFAAREAKVFAEDKEILAVSELRTCLEANDIKKFEQILANKQNKIITDPFLMTYIEPLRRRMREQVLISVSMPFTRVSLAFLAQKLNLSVDVVEGILMDLLIDGRLTGSIDQSNGYLMVEKGVLQSNYARNEKDSALNKWSRGLNNVFVDRRSITAKQNKAVEDVFSITNIQ